LLERFLEGLLKYAVEEADLDDNPDTRDNVMNSKYRSDLKAWLRKYPTPKEQQKHPFQTFERE
jgi:hypothetical protein